MTYSTIRVLAYVALATGLNITDPVIYGALLVCLLLHTDAIGSQFIAVNFGRSTCWQVFVK